MEVLAQKTSSIDDDLPKDHIIIVGNGRQGIHISEYLRNLGWKISRIILQDNHSQRYSDQYFDSSGEVIYASRLINYSIRY